MDWLCSFSFFYFLRISTIMYEELILCLILWSFGLKPLKHLLILYINYHIDTISQKNSSCKLLVILKLHHYCFQWPKSCNQTMQESLLVKYPGIGNCHLEARFKTCSGLRQERRRISQWFKTASGCERVSCGCVCLENFDLNADPYLLPN